MNLPSRLLPDRLSGVLPGPYADLIGIIRTGAQGFLLEVCSSSTQRDADQVFSLRSGCVAGFTNKERQAKKSGVIHHAAFQLIQPGSYRMSLLQ